MWFDKSGHWNIAHDLIDDLESKTAYRVHAYLHRKEGDLANAGYWYKRAGLSSPAYPLDQEWDEIVQSLLGS